jgi:hypothetical protein
MFIVCKETRLTVHALLRARIGVNFLKNAINEEAKTECEQNDPRIRYDSN